MWHLRPTCTPFCTHFGVCMRTSRPRWAMGCPSEPASTLVACRLVQYTDCVARINERKGSWLAGRRRPALRSFAQPALNFRLAPCNDTVSDFHRLREVVRATKTPQRRLADPQQAAHVADTEQLQRLEHGLALRLGTFRLSCGNLFAPRRRCKSRGGSNSHWRFPFCSQDLFRRVRPRGQFPTRARSWAP